MLEAIAQFTRLYHHTIEEHLERYGRNRLPLHGEPTGLIRIGVASDGFVTFYGPSGESAGTPDGVYAFDYSQYDMNVVCQNLTLSRLRISSPRMGESVRVFTAIPDAASHV